MSIEAHVGDHVWEECLGVTSYCGTITRMFYMNGVVKSVETDHTVQMGRFQLRFVIAMTRNGWRNCRSSIKRAHARYTIVTV